MTTGDGLDYFQAQAEQLLPAENQVFERNRAITATYASLFLKERSLFKWAGMAAFASHRVGISLVPFAIEEWAEGRARFKVPPEHQGRALSIDDDLNLLRLTNNRVYASIAWSHLAFSSKDHGSECVLDLSATVPEWRLLRQGWERICQAARRLKQGEPRSVVEPLIWRGNEELLRFEQEVTVQAGFDRMQRAFSTFLTWAMSMEFDGDNQRVELDTFSYFPLYMWTQAFHVLARTRSLPHVGRFDHRWCWVEGSLLPMWKHVEASDRELEQKLKRLAALGDSQSGEKPARRALRRHVFG
jgi:hypothetical protein